MMVIVLSLAMAMILMVPLAAQAHESGKTVRVGWYESPFNTMDQFGRRSGYAYDYQQKIAAYTGWKYEYVEGSWPELLQMLIDGDIGSVGDAGNQMMIYIDADDCPVTKIAGSIARRHSICGDWIRPARTPRFFYFWHLSSTINFCIMYYAKSSP